MDRKVVYSLVIFMQVLPRCLAFLHPSITKRGRTTAIPGNVFIQEQSTFHRSIQFHKQAGSSTICSSSHTSSGSASIQSSLATNSSQDNNDTHTSNEPWWRTYRLKDEELAFSTRKDFPILSTTFPTNSEEENTTQGNKLIYFDSAATSQKPTQVINSITSYYQNTNSNVHRGAHTLSQKATTLYENARDTVANFIHAPSRNEIIFTSGATESLNLIASTYGRANIQPGDEILITEMEHHSNIVPWQMLAEEKGAVLKYIPLDVDNGCLDLASLPSLLSDKTKIVSFQHVSNVMACIHPVRQMVQTIRANAHPDVKIILDACQSIPHMKVNVQELDIDFLAASGHKMCAPTGIGFLWGRESILNSMPPYKGGGEMIDEVYMTHSTYASSPARFEAGTPSIAQAIGLGSAIDYLMTIGGGKGMERIEAYEHELAQYFIKRMSEIHGVTILGPKLGDERAAIVAFVCDAVHPSDLSTFLDLEGIAIRAGHHCCQPLHRALGYSHSARASLYFYNTKEEIDIFMEKLQETLNFFGGGIGGENDDDFVPFI